MMRDFYFEQKRDTITDDWSEDVTVSLLKEKLNQEHVPFRIYYSTDNLTRRIFIFRGNCTDYEIETLLGLGFVFANDGDTENIPSQAVEEIGVEE